MNMHEKDSHLWEIAKKRVAFKRHLMMYIAVNIFLWFLWYFNGQQYNEHGIPWPFWTTIGWGIGILFHYIGAYIDSTERHIEKEYQKLSTRNNNKQ